MDTDLAVLLRSRYPNLLSGKEYSSFRLFGFQCGNGWFALLDGSFQLMATHAGSRTTHVSASQVKEKFGALRLYLRNSNEHSELIADIAELVSGNICELCGKPGFISTSNGWMRARCNLHQDKETELPTNMDDSAAYSSAFVATVTAVTNIIPRTTVMSWLQTPALALGGVKPYEKINSVEGCTELKSMIEKLEHGVNL